MECWLNKPILCVCVKVRVMQRPLSYPHCWSLLQRAHPSWKGGLSSPEEEMVLISEFTVFPSLSPPPADI